MRSNTIWQNIFSGLAGAFVTALAAVLVAYMQTTKQVQAVQDAEKQVTIIQTNYAQQADINEELENQLESVNKQLLIIQNNYEQQINVNHGLESQLESINEQLAIAESQNNDLKDKLEHSSAATTATDLSPEPVETAVSETDDKENKVKLCDIKITESRYYQFTDEAPKEDTVGNKYTSNNLFLIHAQGTDGYGYATYYIGKKYKKLSGIVAVSDESEVRDDVSLKGWVGIYAKQDDDYVMIYSTDELSRETSQVPVVDVDISDAEWIQIRFYNQEEYFNWAQGYHSLMVLLSEFQLK